MSEVKGFAHVVFPARDLNAGVTAWTAMLGREPAFVGEDFVVFSGDGVEVDVGVVAQSGERLEAGHGPCLAGGPRGGR